MRRKKSHVLEAHVPSDHANTSTSEDRDSRHASPSSSSRRRQVSPTDAPLPPSSRRRQISPIQVSGVPDSLEIPPIVDIVDAYALVSLPTTDAVELMSPSDGEVVQDAEPEAFGGDLVELSLLSLYSDHTVRHI